MVCKRSRVKKITGTFARNTGGFFTITKFPNSHGTLHSRVSVDP